MGCLYDLLALKTQNELCLNFCLYVVTVDEAFLFVFHRKTCTPLAMILLSYVIYIRVLLLELSYTFWRK